MQMYKSNHSTTGRKSKLEVNELFVKSPINLKCVLSQNERDFLEGVIHLQSLGRYYTSDSLIMANSGLNSTQITNAKKNLIALELLSVAANNNPQGSRYNINECSYNRLLHALNAIKNADERFSYGDRFRSEHGLKAIFTNIVNTLRRRLSTTIIPEEELLVKQGTEVTRQSPAEQKAHYRQLLDEGKITNEQYYSIVKKIK